MKVSEAIAYANDIRMNTLPDEQKARYLCDLDGEIAEMMGVEIPENTWPEEDRELLMPRPHEYVYVYYLAAMSDIHNHESNLYVTDMEKYNTAMRDARAWWRRHHRPKSSGNWRV